MAESSSGEPLREVLKGQGLPDTVVTALIQYGLSSLQHLHFFTEDDFQRMIETHGLKPFQVEQLRCLQKKLSQTQKEIQGGQAGSRPGILMQDVHVTVDTMHSHSRVFGLKSVPEAGEGRQAAAPTPVQASLSHSSLQVGTIGPGSSVALQNISMAPSGRMERRPERQWTDMTTEVASSSSSSNSSSRNSSNSSSSRGSNSSSSSSNSSSSNSSSSSCSSSSSSSSSSSNSNSSSSSSSSTAKERLSGERDGRPRMAGLGEDSSPPAQDSINSSCLDIKLVLGKQGERGREVTVSREALAGLSPVFKNMLTHDMVEKKQGTVRLEAVSLEAWTVIWAFYFSGKKLLTIDNVQDMVSVVDMYELTDLKNYCDDFLCKNACEFASFSDLLDLATTFRLKNLKTNLLKLIREDFECFIQTDSFLRLNREVLLEILGGPYIVSSEDTVSKAVLRWLQVQNADHDTVEKVLQQLNLQEVCLSCLDKHLSESQYAAFRDVVLCFIEKEKQLREKETLQRLSVQMFAHNWYGKRYLHLPDKSDRPFGPTCGCKSGEAGDLILFGSPRLYHFLGVVLDGTWLKQTEVNWLWDKVQKAFNAACFFGNYLAVKSFPRSVEVIDLKTKGLIKSYSLQQPREKDGMVSMGDALYIVMGEWVGEILDCIDVIRSDTTECQHAGRMLIATTDVAAASVGNLIIASGSSGKEKIYQSFNTETGVAVILQKDQYGPEKQNPCSLGFRGALFGWGRSFVCILLQENGEVAITEEQYPETSAAFSASEFHAPDIQLQQLIHKNPENTVYSVRFSPGGKRANIVPLPLSIDGYIMFRIRK